MSRAGRPLRAAVLGLGVGEMHAAAWDAHPDCELVALCDRDAAKLAQVAERFPRARTTTDPWEVLGANDVDAVSVATYDDGHAAEIVRAVDTGKHVFAEKPLCLHASELRDIRQALRARPEVRLSSNLILRTCPRFLKLRELLRAGEFGDLYHIESSYEYGRLWKIVDGWRGKLPFYSVFLGGAVHLVDLILWLTGERVVRVSAAGNAIVGRGSTFRFPDFVTARLECVSGLLATVNANFGCVRPHFHELALYGARATFRNAEEHGLLWRSRERDASPERLTEPYPPRDKGGLIHGFVDEILGRPGPDAIGTGAVFEVMSVCLAVETSLQTRQTVEVDYI